MPAESPAHSHPAPVCPECGYRHDGPPGCPTPAMLRARDRIPRWLLAIAALGMLSALAVTARFSTLTSGPTMPMFVDPILSYADLQAIARGEVTPGPPLLARMQRVLGSTSRINPGRRIIEVTFDGSFPQATLPDRRTRAIGWPAAWLSIQTFRSYDDPLHRIGLRKAITDPTAAPLPPSRHATPFIHALRIPPNPRVVWFGDLIRYQPPPEETDGIPTLYSLNLSAMLASLGVLILVWCAAALLIRLHRWNRPRTQQRAVIIPWLLTALIAALMLAPLFNTSEPPPSPHLHQSGFTPAAATASPRAGFTRLSIDQDQFLTLAGPEGDRTLAQIILNEVPAPPGPSEYTFLAAACDPESQIAEGDIMNCSTVLPVLWLSRATYERRPGIPDTGPMRRRIKSPVRLSARMLSFNWSPLRTPNIIYSANLDLPRLASLFAAFWLLHRIVSWTIILIQRAQLRSRARLHLCANCRYPIPAPNA